MRIVGTIGVVVLCLLLISCGADDSKPDAGNVSTPTASPTAAASQMTIGPIVWSESADEASGEPIAPVEAFTPQSPAIIASIEVTDMPVGTEFTATWTINEMPIDSDMHVQADGYIDHSWVAFRFTREQGTYPTGQLGVVITASTGELREGSIEIAFP